ncbi:MAG: ImmA/IrrE family metallo-endopeptidase [Cyclobacteriaceae bacterium]
MSNDIEKLLADIFKDEETPSLEELFEQRIKQLGIKKHQAYAALGIDKNSIEPILNGKARQVDTIKLLKIGEFLNLDVSKTIRVYLNQETSKKIGELERTKKAKFIFENFDLDGLKKLGFIDSTSDLERVEERIVSFFGLRNIFEFKDEILHKVAFSKSRVASSEKMKAFWIRTAYAQFEAIDNPYEYSRERLKQLVSRIKPYCRDEKEGFYTVCRALYHAGITVIFQRKIPQTQVRGATFIINNKPCIIITDLFKRYGTIWFALMHELFHALYHFDEIKDRTYHLTGEADLWLSNEEEADDFARRYFLPDELAKFIEPHISNHFAVQKYAREWNVHHCLIYNFHCWKNPDHWKFYGKYDPGVDVSVKKVNAIAFDKETVADLVAEIKTNLELV